VAVSDIDLPNLGRFCHCQRDNRTLVAKIPTETRAPSDKKVDGPEGTGKTVKLCRSSNRGPDRKGRHSGFRGRIQLSKDATFSSPLSVAALLMLRLSCPLG
jgi:hypothetical protein